MISPRCFKTIRLLLLLLVVPLTGLLASSESYVQVLTGHLKKGDSLTVIDDKFLNLPLNEWNQLKHISVDNIISFELRQDTALNYYAKTFSCTLNVTIKYFTSRDQQTPKEIDNVDLVVKYDTTRGKSYPLIARYKFKDAFKVTVVINSISSPEWKDKLPDVFLLKNQILVERKYPFDPTRKGRLHLGDIRYPSPADQLVASGPRVAQLPPSNTGLETVNGTLLINWAVSAFGSAEEYDLEWTYVDLLTAQGKAIHDNYVSSSGTLDIPQLSLESLMAHNSTRVTVTGSQYTINLPYQEGYLLVRIRGVSYDAVTNLRNTGEWNYLDDDGHTTGLYITPYQANLNWQYTGSFAEEGKRKEVITYFDGTLRNRQSVTLSNSDETAQNGSLSTTGTAIVQETIYDVMGRPSMNILPAPVKNNVLDYYSSFNRNSSGISLSSSDISMGAANSCTLSAGPLNTSSGTSQYYSPANSFMAADNGAYSGYNSANFYFTKYVPDAGGYPYALTEYTQDNTGRLRRQGGVGHDLQIGQGHETNYYYGKPTPTQLERLFGMEVGNSSHYLKNMVVDPNGQISVSYIDANGKTIATALAGNVPSNLAALPSSQSGEASTSLNETLIKPADFTTNAGNLNMKASSTFLAEVTGNFTLHYSVNPLALVTSYGTGGSSQLCNNCYYTVKVQISDECGNMVTSATSTPFQGNDYTCYVNPVPVTQDLAFAVNKIGEYTVTYSLQLSNDVINAQTDYYIQHNTDLQKLQDFFLQELQNLDLGACYNTCDACKTLGTTVDDFRGKVVSLMGAGTFDGIDVGDANSPVGLWITQTWTALKARCNSLSCAPASPCDQKLSVLKTDVLPGGQYALYDATALANGSATVFLEPQINVMVFYNQDNAIASLTFVDDDGQTRSVGGLSQADFVNAYLKHPEWADLFVVHHVEYCSYTWCKDQSNPTPAQNNEVSYIFDENLKQNFQAGADAVAAGYYNHADPLALLKLDPFFNGGGRGVSYYSNMQTDLQNLSSVLGIAPTDNTVTPATALPVKNIIQWIDWMLYCKPTVASPTAPQMTASWQSCSPSDNCRSVTMEWQLYLNYYLQVKSKYYRLAKLQFNPACLDCFIGGDALSTSSCIPSGPLTDYQVVERHENSASNFYVVYKNGASPFMSDYTVSYDRESNDPSIGVLQAAVLLNIHKGDMQALISSYPDPSPGQQVVFDSHYVLLNMACTPTAVAACAANGSTAAPVGDCPAAGSFSLQYGTQTQHVSDPAKLPNEQNTYQDVYYVHAGGPVTRPVTIYVTLTQQGTQTEKSGTTVFQVGVGPLTSTFTVTINTGETSVRIGTNSQVYTASVYPNPNAPIPPDGETADTYWYNYMQYTYTVTSPYVSCPAVTQQPASPTSTCTSNPNYLLYMAKTRVFNDYVDVQDYLTCEGNSLSSTPQATATAQAVAAQLQAAMDNLATQQTAWLNMLQAVRDEEFPSLSSTTLSNSVLASLVTNLGLVSSAYLQYASQQGLPLNIVSTLPTGVTASNNYHSFSEVFTALVGSQVASGFSADLLDNVYPYDKVPYSVDPNVTSLSSDIFGNVSTNITALQTAWNGGPGTFGAYLKQQLGDDYLLTDAQLSDLQARIASGCSAPYLANPAILPVAFVAPNPSSVASGAKSYATCSQLADLSTSFSAAYPNVTADTKLYRLLYTNYRNHQLGYPLSYSDYVDFSTQCSTNSSAFLYDKPQSPSIPYDYFACSAELLQGVYARAGQEYDLYIRQIRISFRNAYISKCLSNQASAKVEGKQFEYHYTLYYYDQSGNLVKTIPPEGVRLFTDQQITQMEQVAAQSPASCPAFPTTLTDQPTILTSLSTDLQNNSAVAMEMWLYSGDGSSTRQLRMITPDNKYMYQVAIANKRIWVELYSLQPDASSSDGISITLSNQAVATLPAQLPLQNWTHLVIQSPDGLVGGTMQLYLDGQKLTLTPDASAPSYPFDWEIDGGYTLPTADLSIIRHLRIYNRPMTDIEVADDYQNSCMAPVNALAGSVQILWGRFDVPSFCNNSTGTFTPVTIPDKGSLSVTANPDPSGVLGTNILSNVANTFTVEFWVNPQTAQDIPELSNIYSGVDDTPPYAIFPTNGGLASSGIAGMGVSVGTNGVAVFEHANSYLPALLLWNGAVTGWTHVAIVYNNKTPSLYINGVYMATGSTSTKTTISPSYNFGGGGYGYMTGGLDEVRVWNVARSAGQIAASYNQTLAPSDQNGLVGYWPMDATSGTGFIKDASCNNNNSFFAATAENWVTAGAPLTETDYVEYASRLIVPDHGLATNYAYNSLNQVVQQHTPDAGISTFLYDRLGRLSVSQNAEQLQPTVVDAYNPVNRFSYTRYDALGRIVEVGEKLNASSSLAETDARIDATLQSWLNSGNNRQVTVTAYDQAPSWVPAGLLQDNLRKRVAASALLSTGSDPSQNRLSASYYNYDIDGNVTEQVQENTALVNNEQQFVTNSTGLKHIKYEYDLISGKVNKVLYQDGKWDQFYYQYIYDADNRVVKALSSRSNYGDANLWTNEASYRYYLHGPLARAQLGRLGVQGVDYAYTLQGWLKGVNGIGLPGSGTVVTDMSGDGVYYGAVIGGGNPFGQLGRDALAYSLGYFGGDYSAIGGANATAFSLPYPVHATPYGTPPSAYSSVPLYNGNISYSSYAIGQLESGNPIGYKYEYDQLNRLKAMDRQNIATVTPGASYAWDTQVPDYGEQISYDANGNILTYQRNGTTANGNSLAMDNLTYNYTRDANGNLVNNKLRHINDVVLGNYLSSTGDPLDISDQPTNNYTYNAIGNLIKDQTQKLLQINWTVYGKMASICKTGGQDFTYGYDPGGNRITKTSKTSNGSTISHYVRDAQGNVLAVYQYKANSLGTLTEGDWVEQHLYGSGRLGMLMPHVVIPSAQKLATDAYDGTNDHTEDAGNRLYELTNHLGNTLATISDKLIPLPPAGSTVATYSADIVSAQDYYPFGMQMPGRTYLASGSLNYRYGFNGKENDNEVEGVGNQIDYGMRVYDPRIGKFLSVDPLTPRFPWYTPYQYAGNKPISNVDLDGMEELNVIKRFLNFTVDMAHAPVTYKGVNGIVWRSTYNLHGYAQNYVYFWDQIIEQHPTFLDPKSVKLWQENKVTPRWTPELSEHLESQGYDVTDLVFGDGMIHHHINQGRTALPLTVTEHKEIPVQKNPPGVRVSSRFGRYVNTASVFTGMAIEITGLYTHNPDAMINQLGSQDEVGRVYKNSESGFYFTINSMSRDNEKANFSFSLYSRFDWDDKQKKYVGANQIGSGDSYQEKSGYQSTNYYDMQGKLIRHTQTGTPSGVDFRIIN